MNITITSRDLKDYLLALAVVSSAQPLLAIDDNLNIYSEITNLYELLKLAWAETYRGQRKITINIPEEVQTENANKALRYGFEQVRLFKYPRKPISNIDRAYFIAMAGKLAPIAKTDKDDINPYILHGDELERTIKQRREQ